MNEYMIRLAPRAITALNALDARASPGYVGRFSGSRQPPASWERHATTYVLRAPRAAPARVLCRARTNGNAGLGSAAGAQIGLSGEVHYDQIDKNQQAAY